MPAMVEAYDWLPCESASVKLAAGSGESCFDRTDDDVTEALATYFTVIVKYVDTWRFPTNLCHRSAGPSETRSLTTASLTGR